MSGRFSPYVIALPRVELALFMGVIFCRYFVGGGTTPNLRCLEDAEGGDVCTPAQHMYSHCISINYIPTIEQ